MQVQVKRVAPYALRVMTVILGTVASANANSSCTGTGTGARVGERDARTRLIVSSPVSRSDRRRRRGRQGLEGHTHTHLGAVADDAAVLLARAGQEAGHVLERDERNVERVAEAHEARALHGRVDVQAAGRHLRLVRHDAHRAPAETREANDDVLRVLRHDFEEVAVVHHLQPSHTT